MLMKIDISYSHFPLCILPNQNVIQVEAIKVGIVFSIIIVLALLGLFSLIYQTLKTKYIPRRLSQNIYDSVDESVPSYSSLPFLVRVKCTYVQFLLIGFSSIATFSFNSLHCVEINNNLHLFKQASIQCYQKWQYGTAVFTALWVAPFCISLHFASKLLSKCLILPREFLIILTFPPTIIWYIIKRKILKQLRFFKSYLSN